MLTSLTNGILQGNNLSFEDVSRLLEIEDRDILSLMDAAKKVRDVFCGSMIDICSLVNAKSGDCPEDCFFCAQSYYYQSDSPNYPILEVEEMVEKAKIAEKIGSHRFCIVASGWSVEQEDLDKICQALRIIKEETELSLDCSLGYLSSHDLERLKIAGLERYNHNIETSRAYFEHICTTHTYEDRVSMVQRVKEEGIQVCCGGIIGMGESLCDRVEMAFALRNMEVECVPINILNPRPGTPLECSIALSPMEIIKTVAIFRLILPRAIIKIAGGRERNLRDLQSLAYLAGASGMIIGGYLTTLGREPEKDLQMIRDLGMTY